MLYIIVNSYMLNFRKWYSGFHTLKKIPSLILSADSHFSQMSKVFKPVSKFKPSGDQPEAILRLKEGLENNDPARSDRVRKNLHHRTYGS